MENDTDVANLWYASDDLEEIPLPLEDSPLAMF